MQPGAIPQTPVQTCGRPQVPDLTGEEVPDWSDLCQTGHEHDATDLPFGRSLLPCWRILESHSRSRARGQGSNDCARAPDARRKWRRFHHGAALADGQRFRLRTARANGRRSREPHARRALGPQRRRRLPSVPALPTSWESRPQPNPCNWTTRRKAIIRDSSCLMRSPSTQISRAKCLLEAINFFWH